MRDRDADRTGHGRAGARRALPRAPGCRRPNCRMASAASWRSPSRLRLGPKAFLFDEPMAGMGPEGSKDLTGFLDGLRQEAPILLVEHDMDAVFALADRISVLVYGRIIATGTVDEIRGDPEVRRAYLGEQAVTLLEVSGLESFLRRFAGAVRRRVVGRRGRGRGADGPQRHGQDDDDLVGSRPGPRPRGGRSASSARTSPACSAHRIARLGIGLVPEGRRCFPNLTVRENLVAAARRGRLDAEARQRACSRGCRNGATNMPTRCRAASSRCWRSAAR